MNFLNLKLFFRNLKRDKYISSINVIGLVTGILSALFIFEYVYYERSYNSHNENADNIYRLAYNRYDGNEILWETANSFFPAGDWLKSNYSEVMNQSRITPKHNITISYSEENGGKVFFNEKKAYYGTASMFEVFTIPLVQGSTKGLEKPFTVAISQRAAERYFGRDNPIGEILSVDGSENYEVCAVYENVPTNSIIKSDFFFSMETLYHFRPNLRTEWGYDYGTTYLQLKPGTDYLAFSEKAFPRMVADNYKERLDRVNKRDVFYLQPLQDIHLTSNIEYETEPPGNGKIISILWGFSVFLLIVAWINYINLTTARAVERAQEIGIRKVNGASRLSLVSQFLQEALLFNLICLFLTLLLFVILNPLFKSVTNIGDFNLFRYPGFIFTGLAAFFVGIAASCIYPAIILQSYKPAAVLKGKLKNSADGIFFRKVMVTVQFIISVILLCGTFVATDQANYLMEKEMGVNYHKSMVISAPRTGEAQSELHNKLLVLKNKFMQLPKVEGSTFTSDVPGREIETWFGCYRKGYNASDANGYFQIAVDEYFMDFYDVKVLAGRTFREGETEKHNTIIMNKKAAERAGYSSVDEAVDKTVISGKNELRIVGVVDDFHYKSIKNLPVPTVITLSDARKKYLTLKFNDETARDVGSIIPELESIYQKSFPDQPFDYYLLDDQMQIDLKPDKTFSFVFGLFSVLAILIAVIGIVGLILITISQRMKEIGIRKALGSELHHVSGLLIKEVSVQIVLAIIIATPLAWHGYKNWFLNSYIHHIELNIWMFVAPITVLVTIVFLVIHSLAANAFRLNVSEVLQNE
ncbi:ABC transporter permease [Mangrovibacterium sp.]|uniref:ABC transporter permease n=1 Tax=Mangrovibacterium sp. TaxID=1961364 RepID=UPI00356B17E3